MSTIPQIWNMNLCRGLRSLASAPSRMCSLSGAKEEARRQECVRSSQSANWKLGREGHATRTTATQRPGKRLTLFDPAQERQPEAQRRLRAAAEGAEAPWRRCGCLGCWRPLCTPRHAHRRTAHASLSVPPARCAPCREARRRARGSGGGSKESASRRDAGSRYAGPRQQRAPWRLRTHAPLSACLPPSRAR